MVANIKTEITAQVGKEKMEELMPLVQNETLKRRFRHVVSENVRTINASKALKEKNNSLVNEVEVYKYQMESVEEFRKKYLDGIYEIRQLKEEYTQVISEARLMKSEYTKKFRQLVNTMCKQI